MPENVSPSARSCCDVRRRDRLLAAPDGSNGRWRWRPRCESDSRATCPTSPATPPTPRALQRHALEIPEQLDEVSAFVAGSDRRDLDGQWPAVEGDLGDGVKIVAAEPMQGEPVQGLRSSRTDASRRSSTSADRPQDPRQQPGRDRLTGKLLYQEVTSPACERRDRQRRGATRRASSTR